MSTRRRKKAKVCPYKCGGKPRQTLKSGGLTRCCNQPVVTVACQWYISIDDAPEWQIISSFVIEKQRSNGHYEIQHGSAEYQKVLPAATILLNKAGGDVEVAKAMVWVSFNDKGHRWRSHDDFFSMIAARFLPDVMAKARAKVEGRNQYAARQAQRAADLMWGTVDGEVEIGARSHF